MARHPPRGRRFFRLDLWDRQRHDDFKLPRGQPHRAAMDEGQDHEHAEAPDEEGRDAGSAYFVGGLGISFRSDLVFAKDAEDCVREVVLREARIRR